MTKKRTAIPIAVRAHIEWKRDNGNQNKEDHSEEAEKRFPEHFLILDVETTADEVQALTFGSYRYCRRDDDGRIDCMQESVFYADDLPERDPEGLATLRAYVADRRADVHPTGDIELHLMSQREFLDDIFFVAAYEARAAVVGFNLPFDLSRLAYDCGPARGRFYGGFSFRLWEDTDEETGERKEASFFRPRIRINQIDSKRAFIGFTTPGRVARELRSGPRSEKVWTGVVLDLRTLTFALTGEAHSLRSACEMFGLAIGKGDAEQHGLIDEAYVDYNRRDVAATVELLEAAIRELDLHPIELPANKAFSSASVAKAYLRGMGVTPPSEKFDVPPELLGRAMAGYFGGRAECRIRRVGIMPVAYVDFLSMYPTVNALMDLWSLIIARRIEVVEATEELQAFLEGVTLVDCLDPDLWPSLRFFAEIEPQDDILPVRGEYAASDPNRRSIGVNPLESEIRHWHAGPDVVASKLLTGRAPRVLRAFRIEPRGVQPGLKPVKLGGEIEIDPRKEDFCRKVIEERYRLRSRDLPEAEFRRLDRFLKVQANSGSYGIWAEVNRQRTRRSKETVVVLGAGDPFTAETPAPEKPGEFYFPPFAALTAAGARLMLAITERSVTDRGGSYAFLDTDSMAIAASRGGGSVFCEGAPETFLDGSPRLKTLSWDEVDAIVRRFESLNPYDRDVVPGSILEIEAQNFDKAGDRVNLMAYAISAKRNVLFYDVGPELKIRKYSEHGLGHLLNPTDPEGESREWIVGFWLRLLAEQDDIGLPHDDPEWIDRPAISRITVNTVDLWKLFDELNDGKVYAGQIKPFNFLLAAHVAPLGHPPGVDPKRFQLVAPYTSDPRRWLRMPWFDRYSGKAYRIVTGPTAEAGVVRVKSYRDVFERYATHPESKSADPDGTECGRRSTGLLRRRYLAEIWYYHIGKESNRLEDVQAGLVHDVDEVLTRYDDPILWRERVVPILCQMPRAKVAEEAGISLRWLRAILNGHRQASAELLRRLTRIAWRHFGEPNAP